MQQPKTKNEVRQMFTWADDCPLSVLRQEREVSQPQLATLATQDRASAHSALKAVIAIEAGTFNDESFDLVAPGIEALGESPEVMRRALMSWSADFLAGIELRRRRSRY